MAMARSKDNHGKRVRFTNVVARSGNPHAHTLWVSPEKDSELKQAFNANRVMMVQQSAGGGKADYRTVGFDRAHARGAQILIFPKSLRSFEGAKVVGINFDLVVQPKTEVRRKSASDTKRVPQRERRPKASRVAQKQFVTHRASAERPAPKNTRGIVPR